MGPILVMSSERSGSNLVRRMLAAHPAVAAPPPPHLWRVLAPLIPYYGPLEREVGWRALLDDALALTQVAGSHLEWRHRLTAAEVEPRIRHKSLSGIACALYASYAAREGRPRWACKENDLFAYAFRILDVEPAARIVYLARDGRDVACSIQKVPTHDQHAYFIAREWRDEQMKCLAVWQDLRGSGRATLLRYEDLIARPEEVLRELCAFLALDFEPRMLDFHEDAESQADARKTGFWKNLASPVLSANRAKYRTELGAREIEIFESVAADALALLGYPLETQAPRPRVRGLTRALYRFQNERGKRRKRGALYDEPGRRERDAALKGIRGRRIGDGPEASVLPLAPLLRYD